MPARRDQNAAAPVSVWVRVIGVAAVIGALVSVEGAPVTLGVLFGAGYLIAAVVVRLTSPNRPLEISLGVVDVILIQWATYVTGGLLGPGPFLLVLHGAAAALVGSRRAGVRIALTHAVGLLVVQELVTTGLLTGSRAVSGDLRLLWVITAVWVTALATSWLSTLNERELRTHRRDLEAQAELATRLASASDAEEVSQALVEHLDAMFERPRSVLIGMPPGAAPKLLAHRRTAAVSPPAEGVRSASVLRRAAEQRRTLLVRDLDPIDDVWLRQLLPDARNLTFVPMVAGGKTAAVIVTEHGTNAGTALENRAVVAIERAADHAALALTSVRLRAALTQHALTDALTGVANRRAFDEELERQLAQADRRAGRVSMMLVDLDHFKDLNDEHGHAVGDDVLARVGASLREVVRPNDTVARYGGEEFAVILPETATDEALVVADRVRERIAEVRTAAGVGVTASAGVASVSAATGLDPRRLIREADTALYAAKAAGRNCVRVFEVRAEDARPVAESTSETTNQPTRSSSVA